MDHTHHAATQWMSHENAVRRHEIEMRSLHPVFAMRVNATIRHLVGKGWKPFVYQGKTRTTAQASKNALTGTGIKTSWHRPDVNGSLHGQFYAFYAADIVDERWGWEGPAKNLSYPFWIDLGLSARVQGLTWGGDWVSRDVAHVQMMLTDDAGISAFV